MVSRALAHLALNANPAGERALQFIGARLEDPPLSSPALPLQALQDALSLFSQTPKHPFHAVRLFHRTPKIGHV